MGFLRSFSIDDSLLSGFVAGSDEDFELLISRHANSLFNTAYYATGSLDMAEEILLSVYCEAYRSVAQTNAKTTVKYWFYRQVVEQIVQHLEVAAEIANELSDDSDSELEKDYIEDSSRENIRRALLTLPFEYRMVFVLRDVMQFEKVEVAEILETDEVAVTAILHRSRLMLLRSLEAIAANEDFDELPLQIQTKAVVAQLVAQ